MRLVDSFPGDACRGGDLLTGSSTPIREYQAIHQDRWGTVHRPERVLCLGIWIEEALAKPEGEVCFTESTVRSFGELVGMVPGELLDEVRAELEVANATIEHLRAQLAEKSMVDTVLQRAVNDAMTRSAPPSAPTDNGEVEESDSARWQRINAAIRQKLNGDEII